MEIRIFQKRYGLTNKDMANICQCSLPTIQKWRSGEVAPSGSARQLMNLLDRSAKGDPEKLRLVLKAMERHDDMPDVDGAGELVQIEDSMTKVMDRLELMLESRRKDNQLAESEARYRSMVEWSTDAVCRWLPDTTLTYVNDAYASYFAKHGDNLIGRKWIEFIPEDRHSAVLALVSDLVRRGEPETTIHEAIDKDGRILYHEWRDLPIKDEKGTVVELHSVGRDVTEAKRLKSEVAILSKIHSKLMGRVEHPVLVFDENGTFLDSNPVFDALQPEGEPWKRITDMVPKLTPGRFRQVLRKLESAGQLNYQIQVSDRIFSLEIHYLVEEAGLRRFLGIFHELNPPHDLLRVRLSRETVVESNSVPLPMSSTDKEAIEDRIRQIGVDLNLDHIAIFLADSEAGCIDLVLERCREGINPQMDGLKRLPMTAIPWWIKRLRQNRIHRIDDVDKLPRTAASEKEILQLQGIRSVVAIPILINGELRGFLGADQSRTLRLWHKQELDLLTELRDQIQAAIANSHS